MKNLWNIQDPSTMDTLELPARLSAIRAKREVLWTASRQLTSDEILQLQLQGNWAHSWELLRVAPGFTTTSVHHSRFFGSCYLGVFNGTADTGLAFNLPSGVCNALITNSVLCDGCSIGNVGGCSNYFIGEGALLYNIGTVWCSTGIRFGNGLDLVIGNETGGREIVSFAELTIAAATAVATDRSLSDAYRLFADAYCKKITLDYGVMDTCCRIINCQNIGNAFIGEHARCENTTSIVNVTIFSGKDEPSSVRDGSIIRDSCIQWGCSVDSMAIVEHSLLCEHSHVERHGKVTHSIIGPNTGIAEGEVTSSLVGPFVGFHHQALLIGTIWPEGKGNVAYGANVGSNHTAKSPDQELFAGEGIFFGLGTSIKFPADFSCAPYSIIATGVTTLPQRMMFPFSLINTPSHFHATLSPAINELVPAWVLSDNLYLLRRNEAKFASRNSAKREQITSAIFRPDIVLMMRNARNALANVPPVNELLLDRDLPGIGKNYVTRQNAEKAIDTYSLHIEYFCLSGLYSALDALYRCSRDASALHKDEMWTIVAEEGFAWRSLYEAFDRFTSLTHRLFDAVVASKEKDDIRGRAIMRDYDAVHAPVAEDSVIKKLKTSYSEQELRIEQLKTYFGNLELPTKDRS